MGSDGNGGNGMAWDPSALERAFAHALDRDWLGLGLEAPPPGMPCGGFGDAPRPLGDRMRTAAIDAFRDAPTTWAGQVGRLLQRHAGVVCDLVEGRVTDEGYEAVAGAWSEGGGHARVGLALRREGHGWRCPPPTVLGGGRLARLLGPGGTRMPATIDLHRPARILGAAFPELSPRQVRPDRVRLDAFPAGAREDAEELLRLADALAVGLAADGSDRANPGLFRMGFVPDTGGLLRLPGSGARPLAGRGGAAVPA
jgi:hypothetical protein